MAAKKNSETELTVGQKAPVFSLPDQNGKKMRLSEYNGKWLVIYFYPKDNTPGCTLEAIDFTKEAPKFKKAGIEIVGISPDSGESHCRFIEKQRLDLTLLTDADHAVAQKFGVWRLKKLYGRAYEGIYRSTFLVDPKGKIAFVWYGVQVIGHANQVLEKAKETQKKTLKNVFLAKNDFVEPK
ncbi:MAG: thioredoxin-dependent thiol peroxidase [Candidatus Diapherotrites archaeon]|uniref:thioredoxin-dependent peroxiredoxin n=1 Tax=Candidatus Iainarchaeum sp. TaxID=3101447 RepID=A0A8T4L5T2_9ARCH|nr:thioredoxin-dependent thiol peroxidase [Candidatus Diapherotrites archaeon]